MAFPPIQRTPSGDDEIKLRPSALSLIARRILMLIDGVKTAEVLAQFVRAGEIDGILYELHRKQLITIPGVSTMGDGPDGAAADTPRQRLAGPIDPSRLSLLKQAAIKGLSATRGLQHDVEAKALLTELQEVRSVEEFRGVFAEMRRLIEREVGIDRVHEIEEQLGVLLR